MLLLGLLFGLLGGVQAASAADRASEYHIGPGDSVRIGVYQSPDLSLEARLNDSGVISYPLVGQIKLGGLTVNQAEGAIADALRTGGFVKSPQVMVVVTNVRGNQVNVLGQVGKPGRVPLDLVGMRLTEVLAQAGGVVSGIGSDTVVVVGLRNGKSFRREIDLPSVFQANGRDNDIVIAPDDTIWVDRAPQIYVHGEVQKPGQMRLERGMLVMQAVAAAGGITQRGTLKGLRITRRQADGTTETLEPALNDPLRDGDVMFIRESLF